VVRAHHALVDPLLRTLEVFRLDGDTYRAMSTHRDDQLIRAEPFAEFELELAALWAD
jgi:Uma2 family endonuclease